MARVKAFDPELALSKAMAVFWEKGYAATSIQDLVTAMGINRGSLYDTFQDKRQLYLRAIAHYHTTIVQAAILPLRVPGASRPEIEQHFMRLVESSPADVCRRGCFLTNSLVELASQDTEVATVLRAGLQQVEDAFFCALVRAQDKGEISTDKEIRSLAHYLVTSLQGLRVLSRIDADPARCLLTVKLILSVLD
ncbi:MAG: TetR/AcrR family transcriptional regulator [Leptolyngbyaceae cyanobacterium]